MSPRPWRSPRLRSPDAWQTDTVEHPAWRTIIRALLAQQIRKIFRIAQRSELRLRNDDDVVGGSRDAFRPCAPEMRHVEHDTGHVGRAAGRAIGRKWSPSDRRYGRARREPRAATACPNIFDIRRSTTLASSLSGAKIASAMPCGGSWLKWEPGGAKGDVEIGNHCRHIEIARKRPGQIMRNRRGPTPPFAPMTATIRPTGRARRRKQAGYGAHHIDRREGCDQIIADADAGIRFCAIEQDVC